LREARSVSAILECRNAGPSGAAGLIIRNGDTGKAKRAGLELPIIAHTPAVGAQGLSRAIAYGGGKSGRGSMHTGGCPDADLSGDVAYARGVGKG